MVERQTCTEAQKQSIYESINNGYSQNAKQGGYP